MEALGFNTGLLLLQLGAAMLFIAFPIVSLIDLAKKKMSGTPLAIWALIICAVPVIGSLAYWIIKPSADDKM